MVNNRCESCPPGTRYDPSTKYCVSICYENSYYSGTKCICKKGFYEINGKCSTCPYGTTYDHIKYKCVCPKDYRWDEFKKKCVRICRDNEVDVEGVCKCIKHYYRVNGGCQKCPPKSIYS